MREEYQRGNDKTHNPNCSIDNMMQTVPKKGGGGRDARVNKSHTPAHSA